MAPCNWYLFGGLLLIYFVLPKTVGLCRNYQNGSNVISDCHSQVLYTIPINIPDYITHLNFSRNPIKNISYNPTLSRFFNLKVLDLSSSYISEVSFVPEIFSEMTTLQQLYLQNTRLSDVGSPLLRDSSIKVLRLDHNRLSYIPADFLLNLPRLEDLSLSHCHLESVSPNAFRSIATGGREMALKRLDLSHNRLHTLSIDLKPYIFTSFLETVRLYNNFWSCDCHLRWLREEVEKTQASWYFRGYSVVPACEEPFKLKHESWLAARADKYGCPPLVVDPQANLTAEVGSKISLKCTVLTDTRPNIVQWTVDNITLEYRSRFKVSQVYNGSMLTTILTVTPLVPQDFAVYNCTVNTTFGSVTQLSYVTLPVKAPLMGQRDKALIAVIAVISVLLLLGILFVVAYLLKRRFSYAGRLYMDGDTGQKSDGEMSSQLDDDDVTVTTPLNQTVSSECQDRPDIIKCYNSEEGVELECLPVESEYPTDDAGCAEYNKYLEITSSANNSPTLADPSLQSPPTNRVVSPVRYAQSPPTFLPTISPNHSPVYQSPTNHAHAYNRTVSPANQTSGFNGNLNSPVKQRSNFNMRMNSPANPLVPYSVDTPTSQNSTSDIISRLNTTPTGSPLTFIKEEQEPEETNAELL